MKTIQKQPVKSMSFDQTIRWLLEGDVSIQYQTYRDLLGIEKPGLRNSIAREGWGKRLLSLRHANGHWARGFYQPKWTSTHYTILDLKNLAISPGNKPLRSSVDMVLKNEKGHDGGINPSRGIKESDVCISGMVLNYASYFGAKEKVLESIVDFILGQKMPDGGFNCYSNRKGAVHSSLHTTLSILEGIFEYERNGYSYRLNDLQQSKRSSQQLILMHKLFKSDKTGDVISNKFLTLHYPCRWFYDILKALDYFQAERLKFDERMTDALMVVLTKRTAEGLWKLPSKHPGEVHFDMEQAGKPSRWNTLRAMRVLQFFWPQQVANTNIS